MSFLDALKRGWWSGWAEFPELVAGGAGLLESLIPGDRPDDPLERAQRWGKEAAEGLRLEAGEGRSEGLGEKVVEGLGAAPGMLASMAPFLLAGEAAIPARVVGAGAALARPALGFGAHGLVRHGDEGLPTAVGHGLRGAAEGAMFGLAGGVAARHIPKGTRKLIDQQSRLRDPVAREAMQASIDAEMNAFGAQAARRAIHAGLSGGIVGGMGVLHQLPAEDVVAGATTMGILGALGGVTPKQIKAAGRYRDPFINVKRGLDKLESEVATEGDLRAGREIEREIAALRGLKEPAIGVEPEPAIGVKPSDFEAAGLRSRPIEKETKSFTEKTEAYGEDVVRILKEQKYGERGEYIPRSDADTARRAATELFRDADGKVQVSAENLDVAAHYLEDLRIFNQAKLREIDSQLARAKASGNEIDVAKLNEIREAHILQTASDHMQLKGVRSVLGNGLRVLGRAKRDTPEWLDAAAKLKKLAGTEYERVVRMLEMSQDNPELMMKIVRAVDTPSLWDYFQEYWINGLLSGLPTHAVNFNSNSLRSSFDMAEKYAALQAEVRLGDPTTGKKLAPEHARGEMSADIQSMWQSLRLIPKILRGAMGSEDFQMSTIRSDLGVHQRSQKMDAPTRAIGGRTGKIARYPGRMLQAMDLVFKAIAGERAAAAKAYRIAAVEEGLSGKALETRINDLRGRGEMEIDTRILDAMKYEGQAQTFTEALPPWMGPVEKLRQTKFMGTRPLVGALPFLATPFNVIKQALLRSPLGFLQWKGIKQRYKNGQIDSKQYYQEKAATIIGTTLTGVLIGMAKAGFITGSGPVNQQDRQNLLSTGWRPYSLKLPGMGYFQLQRLEPLGTIIGMAGDIAEFGGAEDKVGKLMATVKNNATDKSFLYGLESLAKAWASPEQFGSTYYRQMTGSLVPTFFAKAAQAVDPYQRVQEARGAEIGVPDAMAYRIPGLSGSLAPRTTIFGEPAERWGVMSTDTTLGKVASGIQSVTMPMPWSVERASKDVEREFDRLRGYERMPPSMPKRTKKISLRGANGENVKLKPEEYAIFDKWHQQAKQHISRVITAPSYARMPDALKAATLRKIYDKYRRAAHKEVNNAVMRRTTVGE